MINPPSDIILDVRARGRSRQAGQGDATPGPRWPVTDREIRMPSPQR